MMVNNYMKVKNFNNLLFKSGTERLRIPSSKNINEDKLVEFGEDL
jgi:hypothetical protein